MNKLWQIMHSCVDKLITTKINTTPRTTTTTIEKKKTKSVPRRWVKKKIHRGKRSHLKYKSFFAEIYNFNLQYQYCRFNFLISYLSSLRLHLLYFLSTLRFFIFIALIKLCKCNSVILFIALNKWFLSAYVN